MVLDNWMGGYHKAKNFKVKSIDVALHLWQLGLARLGDGLLSSRHKPYRDQVLPQPRAIPVVLEKARNDREDSSAVEG